MYKKHIKIKYSLFNFFMCFNVITTYTLTFRYNYRILCVLDIALFFNFFCVQKDFSCVQKAIAQYKIVQLKDVRDKIDKIPDERCLAITLYVRALPVELLVSLTES